MPYVHGVKTSEVPTSLLPPVQSDAGIPFVVGMAPINMTDPTNVNKPVLCSSYAEAVAKFGYAAPVDDSVSGLKKHEFTISEFIQSQFALFQSAPVVIVNVLDPETHYTAATANKVKFDAQTATVTVQEKGIILSSVKLGPSGSQDGIDSGKFTASFDDEGNLVLAANKNNEQEYYYTLDTDVNFAANVCRDRCRHYRRHFRRWRPHGIRTYRRSVPALPRCSGHSCLSVAFAVREHCRRHGCKGDQNQ